MNASRFFPVRLCQAFDGENSSSGSGSSITRRSFLRRTGGVTVATLVAWNLASQDALAAGDCLGSCSHLVEAIPSAATQDVQLVESAGVTAFARVTCTPAGGPSKSKVLKIIAGAYVGAAQNPHPNGATTAEQYSVSGAIINNSPDGCFTTSAVATNNDDCPITADEDHALYGRVVSDGLELPSGSSLHHKYKFKIQVISMNRVTRTEKVKAEAPF